MTDQLISMDPRKEQQKAEFIEHLYRCSGRKNGLYTNLWKEFCMGEAGPYCRDLYFERKQAMLDYLNQHDLAPDQ